jgi:hypothetical protein
MNCGQWHFKACSSNPPAALDVTIALTALEFRKTDRTAALLLLPYLAWWVPCCDSSCRPVLSGGFSSWLFATSCDACGKHLQLPLPPALCLVQTTAAVWPSDARCAALCRCTYATALNYNIMVNNSPQVGNGSSKVWSTLLLTCCTEQLCSEQPAAAVSMLGLRRQRHGASHCCAFVWTALLVCACARLILWGEHIGEGS